MVDIDKAAEAIWQADKFIDWGVTSWTELDSECADIYRRMAQAVIDSLELIEEVRNEWDGLSWEDETRLVSPWVRSETDNA